MEETTDEAVSRLLSTLYKETTTEISFYIKFEWSVLTVRLPLSATVEELKTVIYEKTGVKDAPLNFAGRKLVRIYFIIPTD